VFGHADVLVNNAGAFSTQGLLDAVDPKKWWLDFEVNVRGAYLVTQAFPFAPRKGKERDDYQHVNANRYLGHSWSVSVLHFQACRSPVVRIYCGRVYECQLCCVAAWVVATDLVVGE
jgi:NAD(P)-dependent dehydrogenase (short-subunit alcohol dehydrogenase family)